MLKDLSFGYGSEINHPGTAGFSPWFPLLGLHVGYLFSIHLLAHLAWAVATNQASLAIQMGKDWQKANMFSHKVRLQAARLQNRVSFEMTGRVPPGFPPNHQNSRQHDPKGDMCRKSLGSASSANHFKPVSWNGGNLKELDLACRRSLSHQPWQLSVIRMHAFSFPPNWWFGLVVWRGGGPPF